MGACSRSHRSSACPIRVTAPIRVADPDQHGLSESLISISQNLLDSLIRIYLSLSESLETAHVCSSHGLGSVPAYPSHGFVFRYAADGLLDRNRDPLTADLAALVAAARSPFLADLFRQDTPAPVPACRGLWGGAGAGAGAGGGGGAGVAAGRTVAWEFRRQVRNVHISIY